VEGYDLAEPVTFTYNADGKRVAKQTDADTTTKFLYDFNRLLREDDGTTQTQYTSTIEEYGDLISEYDDASQQSSYHHYDALGSTDALIDPDAAATTRHYAYRAFGEISSPGEAGTLLVPPPDV